MVDCAGGRVRTPFRILGAVLGGAFVLTGIALVIGSIYELITHRHEMARTVLERLGLGVADASLGLLMLRAAITGRDPYVPDTD